MAAQADSTRPPPVAGVSRTLIDADAATHRTAVPTVTELIGGRSPGMTVFRPNGLLGTGGVLRARGVRSFSLSENPIVEIDGIVVPAQTAILTFPAFGSAQAVRVGGESMLDQVDPEDVSSIEIVPGIAGAIAVGPNPAGGVIRIRTKRGHPGRTTWRWTSEGGVLIDPADYGATYFGYDPASPRLSCALPREAAGACSTEAIFTLRPQDDPTWSIFRRGFREKTGLAVSGTKGGLRYAISGRAVRERGTFGLPEGQSDFLRTKLAANDLPDDRTNPNRLATASVRANLDAPLAPGLDLQVSTGWWHENARLPFADRSFLGSGSNRETFYHPVLLADGAPGATTTRLAMRGAADEFDRAFDRRLDGVTAGATVRWDPGAALRGWVTVAAGHSRLADVSATADTIASTGSPFTRVDSTRFADTHWQADLGLTWTALKASTMTLRLTGGFQARRRSAPIEVLSRSTLDGTVGGQSSTGKGTLSTIGGILGAALELRDRVILSAVARRDATRLLDRRQSALTSFGANVDGRLTDPMTEVQVGLHGSVATTPRRPGLDDDNNSASFIPLPIGGVPIGGEPERLREFEAGVWVSSRSERFRVDLTWFDDRLTGGWVATPLINGTFVQPTTSRLSSRGIEGAVSLVLASSDRLSWTAGATATSRHGVVDDLDAPPVFADFTCHSEGKAPHSLCGLTLGPVSDRNADGLITPDELPTPRYTVGPSSLPTRTASLRTSLGLRRWGASFEVGTQVDYAGGGSAVDIGELYRCQFSLCRGAVVPGSSPAAQARAMGFFPLEFATDASYWRLREVTLGVRPGWRPFGVTSVGLSVTARNLLTATSYPGWDPEVRAAGGNVPNELFAAPLLRSVVFRVAVDW